ncbi:hypothetical protein ACFZAU_21170 [Streptomyces sp. NPDC008238]
MASREHAAPVIVHPPVGGGRRVSIQGRYAGTARRLADLLEFLWQAGIDPDSSRVLDPDLVEWCGGGPDEWC